MKDLTFQEYSVKNYFDFVKKFFQQSSHLFMASLNITSLFINNIPLDKFITTLFQILIEKVLRNC